MRQVFAGFCHFIFFNGGNQPADFARVDTFYCYGQGCTLHTLDECTWRPQACAILFLVRLNFLSTAAVRAAPELRLSLAWVRTGLACTCLELESE